MPENTDVVVLCGGRGSRMAPLTDSVPKPLLSIAHRPFLFYLLQNLRRHSFRRFILATHHLSEKFTDFVNAYRDSFPETAVVIEDRPLGTGGALRHAAGFVRSPVFVTLNGDSWVTQSFVPVLDLHARMGNTFTMVATRTENVVGGSKGKGGLVIGPDGEIKGLVANGQEESWLNAGAYVLDRDWVLSWPVGRYDLEPNLLDLLGRGKGVAFLSSGRLLDIGTPECYAEANRMPGFFAVEEVS
jgi:mannose-1-phosphate guanylyltransferase